MFNITSTARDRYLQNSVIKRGYISIVPLGEEDPIIIDESNRLQQIDIEDFIYGKDLLGGTVAKKCTVKILNIGEEFELENREIDVYLGIELEDESIEYMSFGRYIITDAPVNKTVVNVTTITALDYMVKFNKTFEDRLTYPSTLKELYIDISEQCDVVVGDVNITNGDFVLENNQFVAGETCRNVLEAIAQISGGSAHIGRDNMLYIKFPSRATKNSSAEGTDIALTDSAEAEAEITGFECASSQNVSVQGKNLFDTLNGNTTLGEGVTILSRDSNQITLNATTGGSRYFTHRIYLSAGNYVLSRNFTVLSGTPLVTTGNVNITTDSGSFISYLPSGSLALAFTITTGGYYKLIFFISTATLVTDLQIKFNNIQIETGTAWTSWQAFTPNSPSPDYPSAILSTGDGGVVNVLTAKDLLNKNNGTILSNYFIFLSGLIGTGANNKTIRIEINPNTEYKIIKKIGLRFRAGFYQNTTIDGVTLNGFVVDDTNTTLVVTSNSTDKYLFINYFTTGTNEQEILDSIQVYESPTEYPITLPEGYVGGSLPNGVKDTVEYVEGGKNLLDLSQNFVLGYVDSNNVIIGGSVNILSDYIEIEPDIQYTLSVNKVVIAVSFAEYDESLNLIRRIGQTQINTFTASSNAKYIRAWFNLNNTAMTVEILETLKPMLEKNSTRSEYQPYGLTSGNKFVKRINEVVLNGSEVIGLDTTLTNVLVFNVPTSNGKTSGYCISDKFIYQSSSNDIEHLRLDGSSPSQIKVYILKSRLVTQDVAGFKTYLASNPITVQYQLAEPIYYDTTLPTIQTYLNNTNITTLNTPKADLFLDYISMYPLDVIDKNNYFELEKNLVYGPVNRVVLRNSQVERRKCYLRR